jgi:hypothetical protein
MAMAYKKWKQGRTKGKTGKLLVQRENWNNNKIISENSSLMF